MRAFIITIDALIGITLIFVAALLIYTQTFVPYAPRGVHLKQLTLDVLTVMERNGDLGIAIDGNSSGVRWLLQSTPELVCMHISINETNGDAVATIPKDNCWQYGKEVQTVIMPTVHEGDTYIVKAQSWYRKELT